MDLEQMNKEELRHFLSSRSNDELRQILQEQTEAHHLAALAPLLTAEISSRPPSSQVVALHLALGGHLNSASRFDEELLVYENAIEVARHLDRQAWVMALCLLSRGNALQELGRFGEALESYDDAELLFAHLGKEHGVARCRANRANALARLGRDTEALAACDAAEPIFAFLGQEADLAYCRMNRAAILDRRGHHAEALATFEEATQVFAREGDEIGAAFGLMNRAAALAQIGSAADAIAAYDAVEPMLARLGKQTHVASCRMGRGLALLQLGRDTEALAAFDSAEPIFAHRGQETDLALCRMNRALVLLSFGRLSEALAALEGAQAVFERFGSEGNAALCRLSIASVLRRSGRGDAALAALDEVEPVFARLGLEARVGTCRMNRAIVLRTLGRHAEALAEWERAEPIFARFEQFDAQVLCFYGLGNRHLALDDPPAALASFEAACDALEQALTRVSSRDEDVAELRGQLPDPFLPAVALLLEEAATATAEARQLEAAALRERAFRLAERARSARLREELGRRLVAGLGLESADPELVARWRALQGELALLDLRLRNEGRRGGGALEEEHEAQQGRRGELLAELTAVERELFAVDPEAAGLLSARLPELEELRAVLAEGEGLVCYLYGDEGGSSLAEEGALVAFCLDRDSLEAQVLEAPDAEALAALAAGVAACERDEFTGAGSAEAWQAQLAALGAHLLAPPAALGWLEGAGRKRRLTFVPSGPLFGLPFAALGLPGRATYAPLVSACEVALAPQAFTRLYQKGKGEEAAGAVALIDPGEALGYGELEKAALERALPGFEGNTHRGPLSAEEALALMTDRALVHLSCHGRFEPGAPWQSRLVFHGEGEQPETYLSVLQLFSRPPGRQRLFVAAACQSGVNNVLAGDALLGLDRALLYRARQVLVALWSVADAATVDLEASFYRAYAAKPDPVAALATAQNAFLDGVQGGAGGPAAEYPGAHPYYWAGFVVMG